MKNKTTAYLLLAAGLFGLCGLHRFYLGKVGTGLIWLFTLGLLGVGQIIDVFTLGGQVDEVNAKRGYMQGGGQANTQKSSQNVVVNVQTPSPDASEKAVQGSHAGELERLVKLLDEGHITKEEFDRQKSRLFEG